MTEYRSEEDNESEEDENGSALERFFAKYSRGGFKYRPERQVIDEYYRLLDVLGLNADDNSSPRVRARVRALRDELKDGLRDAMVLEFNSIYGTDVNSVASWQCLCRVLGVSSVPTTLDECKEAGYVFPHIHLVVDAKLSPDRHRYSCQPRRSSRRRRHTDR